MRLRQTTRFFFGVSMRDHLVGPKEVVAVHQVSIETAQAKLDCSVLEKLPSKTILLGVLDLSDMRVETPETVAARIRRALPHVPPERIVVAPDCGLKYLPREVAFGKLQAMVAGAAIVRRELAVAG
jgi:5-methyltetrahydropteroyltriglutamate--homocysteine methyltransferase